MRIQSAVLGALLLCACSGETPVGSTSSSSASASSGATSSGASSSASSSSSAASSSGSSTASTSSSSSSSGSATSSSGSSGSGSTGSSGTTGAVDAGPADAGPFTYSTDPHTYWCNVFVDGGFTSFAQDDGGCIAALPDCAGIATPLGPAIHVLEPQRIAYHEDPPNGGPHWGCWAPWGDLHAHVALPAERFIHNSEHQGVILLYRCDPDAGLPDGGSCDAMAAPLVAFANDGGPADPMGCPTPRYIVTARPTLPNAYAAVAWGWTLVMDDWDAGVASCFAAAHLGAGPEPLCEPPPVQSCPQSYLP